MIKSPNATSLPDFSKYQAITRRWPGCGGRTFGRRGELGVLVTGCRRHRRMQAVAGVAGNVMLQRVRHLLAADEFRAGGNPPEIRARRMVTVLVRGQDVLHLLRIEADRFDGRPFALER
jgi:hypothetical protein